MHFNSHAHVERDKATNEILRKLKISTHTLTWSVTPNIEQITKNMENFNSHAHVERDLHLLRLNCKNLHFNSHAHVERDVRVVTVCKSLFLFQLTRSRGAWPMTAVTQLSPQNFNSHAHVERDKINNPAFCIGFISTHTLTWSVTCVPAIPFSFFLFQLTRSRGAWRMSLAKTADDLTFQLTRSRGAWHSLHRFSTLAY